MDDSPDMQNSGQNGVVIINEREVRNGVLEIVLAIVVAYLVVMGALALLYSWLGLRNRRTTAAARHRQGRTRPGGIAGPGGGGVR